MIDITQDKLVQLIQNNLYEDMVLEGEHQYSKIGGLHALVDSKSEHYQMLTLNKDRYDLLISKAKEQGSIPMYICSTPNGIWEFNLEIILPEVDNSVVYVDINRGRPILPWYPDFNSEAEWVADSLYEYSDNPEDSHDLDIMLQEMIDSEIDFDKEFDPSAE
jgi:hypothetical protein